MTQALYARDQHKFVLDCCHVCQHSPSAPRALGGAEGEQQECVSDPEDTDAHDEAEAEVYMHNVQQNLVNMQSDSANKSRIVMMTTKVVAWETQHLLCLSCTQVI